MGDDTFTTKLNFVTAADLKGIKLTEDELKRWSKEIDAIGEKAKKAIGREDLTSKALRQFVGKQRADVKRADQLIIQDLIKPGAGGGPLRAPRSEVDQFNRFLEAQFLRQTRDRRSRMEREIDAEVSRSASTRVGAGGPGGGDGVGGAGGAKGKFSAGRIAEGLKGLASGRITGGLAGAGVAGATGFAAYAASETAAATTKFLVDLRDGNATIEGMIQKVPILGGVFRTALNIQELVTETQKLNRQLMTTADSMAAIATAGQAAAAYERQISDYVERAARARARVGATDAAKAEGQFGEQQLDRAKAVREADRQSLAAVEEARKKSVEAILASKDFNADEKQTQIGLLEGMAKQARTRILGDTMAAVTEDAALAAAEGVQYEKDQERQQRETIEKLTDGYADAAKKASDEKKQIAIGLAKGEQASRIQAEVDAGQREEEAIEKAYAKQIEDLKRTRGLSDAEEAKLEEAKNSQIEASAELHRQKIQQIAEQANRTREDAQASHLEKMADAQGDAQQKALRLAGHTAEAETQELVEGYRKKIAGIRGEARKAARDNPAEAAAIQGRARQEEAAAAQQFSLDWMLKTLDRQQKYRVTDSSVVTGESRLMSGVSGDPYKAQQQRDASRTAKRHG